MNRPIRKLPFARLLQGLVVVLFTAGVTAGVVPGLALASPDAPASVAAERVQLPPRARAQQVTAAAGVAMSRAARVAYVQSLEPVTWLSRYGAVEVRNTR